MTSIAYRSGIVACDSRLTDGDTVLPQRIQKIRWGKRNPVIYAVCGAFVDCCAAVDWLEDGPLPWISKRLPVRDHFDLGDHSSVMVIEQSRRVHFVEGKHWFEATGDFFAMGSGQVAALAAMHCGASAKKAVEIACKLDAGSALPVHYLNLANPPKGRRNAAAAS